MTRDFIVLASASPRRAELLRQIGVRFEVRAAAIDERALPAEAPEAYVRRLAAAKAAAVAATVGAASGGVPRPVLAADTAVVLEGDLLGKPADEREAMAMLERLSGRTHRVMTAVAVRCGAAADLAVSASEVRFRATTAAERRAYCRTREPFDKAGGYGIQGGAAVFVEHLSGSYSGVVGLPLCETAALLAKHGVVTWQDAAA
jgi:septum formation protein